MSVVSVMIRRSELFASGLIGPDGSSAGSSLTTGSSRTTRSVRSHLRRRPHYGETVAGERPSRQHLRTHRPIDDPRSLARTSS